MVDSGATKATCPRTHLPGIAAQHSQVPLDIRTANGERAEHHGQKTVTCTTIDNTGVEAVVVDWDVADATHPI